MPQAWYKDGLRFACTQCGNCCTGAPGYVWINDDEIAALAKRLGLDDAAFRRKYVRTVGKRGTSLVEKPNNDCVFFAKGKGCTVYEHRPKQCRTWPFWKPLLRSRSDWDAASQGCPGINRGPVHDAAHIAATAADDGLV